MLGGARFPPSTIGFRVFITLIVIRIMTIPTRSVLMAIMNTDKNTIAVIFIHSGAAPNSTDRCYGLGFSVDTCTRRFLQGRCGLGAPETSTLHNHTLSRKSYIPTHPCDSLNSETPNTSNRGQLSVRPKKAAQARPPGFCWAGLAKEDGRDSSRYLREKTNNNTSPRLVYTIMRMFLAWEPFWQNYSVGAEVDVR